MTVIIIVEFTHDSIIQWGVVLSGNSVMQSRPHISISCPVPIFVILQDKQIQIEMIENAI